MPDIQEHADYARGFYDAGRGEREEISHEYEAGWLAYWECVRLLAVAEEIG